MLKLTEVPEAIWYYEVKGDSKNEVIKVFQGGGFLVQVRKHNDCIRLTVNKTSHTIVKGKPVWKDRITWDELQEIKNQCGYSDKWLCEYYPPKDEVVNVANIRHLWVMDIPPVNKLNDRVERNDI